MLVDLDKEQIAGPRCFKTHQPLSQLSHMDSKFLCVIRDPETTLVSNFKFLTSKGAVFTNDVNEFARTLRWMPGGTGDKKPTFGARVWDFYKEFYQCRHLPNGQSDQISGAR